MFQDGIQDDQQFAHAGDQGNGWFFTRCTQPFVEVSDHGIASAGRQRSHVQGRAYVSSTTPNDATPPQCAAVPMQWRDPYQVFRFDHVFIYDKLRYKLGLSEECSMMNNDEWIPVSSENCEYVKGPFYHGTKSNLATGDLLTSGHSSNYAEGRVSNHIYFSAQLEPAIWGAELAMSLSGLDGRGRIYIVEPTGPFEDDPNLTNKKFPGNPTRSYRTREPLRIVGVVEGWVGHPTEVLQGMLDSLENLKRQGLAVIED
jgi:rifampin ADP-ribosylating transferase